jgi:hypothetical protein
MRSVSSGVCSGSADRVSVSGSIEIFMSRLNPATRRRLLKLPQENSVWEGDRRTLHEGLHKGLHKGLQVVQGEAPEVEDYVLWVDGTQGMVRSMDTIPPETGPEAIVRTLLQAIEYPHQPGRPGRPKKVVVRDREIQLYLKSILQDLEITLEFVPELPLIDDLFESFQAFRSNRPPDLPPKYGDLLLEKAEQLWTTAPWVLLSDHQILELEINQWDIGSVYVSVLGKLGMEFGVLAYRNLESLKEFRMRAMARGDMAEMEAAFLAQDCIFLNYDTEELGVPYPGMLRVIPYSMVEPNFGSLHPLEGMRPFLHEDETIALVVILEALHRFVSQNRGKLFGGEFPALSRNQKIPLPSIEGIPNPLTVKVSTLPDLAAEFLMEEEDDDEDLFRDDLVPENAFVGFGQASPEFLKQVRSIAFCYEALEPTKGFKPGSDNAIPTILVQTSAAKAKAMIKIIQSVDGVEGIGFNPGDDPMMINHYDLGLLKAKDGTLFLLQEFDADDPEEKGWVKLWEKRAKASKGRCALLIAKGNTGATKGNPRVSDIIGVFEAKVLTEKDFGFD